MVIYMGWIKETFGSLWSLDKGRIWLKLLEHNNYVVFSRSFVHNDIIANTMYVKNKIDKTVRTSKHLKYLIFRENIMFKQIIIIKHQIKESLE